MPMTAAVEQTFLVFIRFILFYCYLLQHFPVLNCTEQIMSIIFCMSFLFSISLIKESGKSVPFLCKRTSIKITGVKLNSSVKLPDMNTKASFCVQDILLFPLWKLNN